MNKEDIKRISVVLLSAFIYALNVKVFVEGGNLFPGGFSGISLLFTKTMSVFFNIEIAFGYIYVFLNIIVIGFVYRFIGKKFMMYSMIHIFATSFFSLILPSFPITDDLLLISVFGGIINGIAIVLSLRVGASSGGTDFIAIYTSNKYRIQSWQYVMYFNAGVLMIAGVLFGFNQSLYSIIYQFCSTQIVTNLHKRYKLSQIMLITEQPDLVSQEILAHFRHGITKLEAEGMYSHTSKYVLLLTCGSFQVHQIIKTAQNVDEKIFINVSNIEKVVGNYYQQPLD